MTKLRSPNYPNYDLETALGLIDKVYSKDGRNKVSRITLAKHLGHEGLSGPALGKIGALRAFGLLDGTGDELKVSDDAISALKAPVGSSQRIDAIKRLASKPSLYQMIQRDYPTAPSKENLTFSLIQQGFSETAAGIAADCYLTTIQFVAGLSGVPAPSTTQSLDMAQIAAAPRETLTGDTFSKIAEGERELTTGLLSKEASFRLIVTGHIGVREIERLIRKLELDKEILADHDE